MTKAALYARYSTDMQSQSSIEDQFRTCRSRADREGWAVYREYSDRAISGQIFDRPGLQDMLDAAEDGKFDVVISEALDRLSRDQEDMARIYKQLAFLDIPIITLSEGEINEMHIGISGTMATLYIKGLADKTRRGLQGRALEGKSVGGRTYGYETIRQFNQKGEVISEERRIVPEEAAIVRRIYAEYLAGKSPRKIAMELNAEGVPSPSGKAWGQTSLVPRQHRWHRFEVVI